MPDYEDTEFGDLEGAIERAKTAKSTVEPQTFKEAFAAARKGGDDVFTWQGKKYTTELAGGKKAAPSRMLSPTESSGSGDYAPAPGSTPSKPAPTRGTRVGRAGQATAGADMPEPTQANIDAANLKRAQQRQQMMDSPLARVFSAIRARGEAGAPPYAKGGKVKKMASGGVTQSSASKRADGIAAKGKTRGRMV